MRRGELSAVGGRLHRRAGDERRSGEVAAVGRLPLSRRATSEFLYCGARDACWGRTTQAPLGPTRSIRCIGTRRSRTSSDRTALDDRRYRNEAKAKVLLLDERMLSALSSPAQRAGQPRPRRVGRRRRRAATRLVRVRLSEPHRHGLRAPTLRPTGPVVPLLDGFDTSRRRASLS
jgi:hypothetical protein